MPTALVKPAPSGPVVVSTPGVCPNSGWPGVRAPHWRSCFRSETVGGDSGTKFGTPYVAGASVRAEILAQARDKKVIVFKYKSKKNYRRLRGHRQYFTEVVIRGIDG